MPLVVVKMCLRETTVYRCLMGGTQTSESEEGRVGNSGSNLSIMNNVMKGSPL